MKKDTPNLRKICTRKAPLVKGAGAVGDWGFLKTKEEGLKNMKRNIKTRLNNGITLVALMITIIVLLILAGVTLSLSIRR